MRILVSGAFHPSFEALPEYIVSALGRLGHEVFLFDHRRRPVPGRLRRMIPGLERVDRSLKNALFLRNVRRLRPSLVLVNQGMILDPPAIARARDLGARCVNWFSDYPAEFEAGLAAAPAYDAFYVASTYAVGRHLAAGHRNAAWLPFACDPTMHCPSREASGPSSVARGARVVFVGSHYPERQILLRFLRGLPVAVWGPGWERASSDPHLAPMIRGTTPLRPARWRELYASADVVLNIHYGAFGPQEVSGDLANTRVFEILGCGAYQLVDRQKDVLRLFREGLHLDAFSGGDELRTRVETALRDDGHRQAVARRGREAVLAAHTYEHRARLLLEPEARGFPMEDDRPDRSPFRAGHEPGHRVPVAGGAR
jgi:spore maturation protein CgeB